MDANVASLDESLCEWKASVYFAGECEVRCGKMSTRWVPTVMGATLAFE